MGVGREPVPPAMVPGMPDHDHDPIASTQMFRAFAHRDEPAPVRRLRPPVILLGLILAAALIALVAWLVVR
jgi:hypothetical protein